MQKTAQGELCMIRNGLVTDVGPPFRPARHRVTDGGARRRPYLAVLMVDSFVPAYTMITWTVWPLGKPATARGDPTGRASRMRPRPSSEGSVATPLLSLPRGWRAGQVVPSSAARLEAPAERLAAKDQAVHGFGGGQQVTTMLSVPIAKAPLMPPTATTLSAYYATHDSKSTHVVDRSAKRPARRSRELPQETRSRLSDIADHGQQVRDVLSLTC